MSNICLSCAQIVDGNGINPNYHGMRIHYGQDWYCGPVIEVSDDIQKETLKFIISEKEEKDWLQDFFNENYDWEESNVQ